MNKKYERYINFIVDNIEAPYYENMRDAYGLKKEEYELVLSKVFNEPVGILGSAVFNTNGNIVYSENRIGYWYKREYDNNGNKSYYENSNGQWSKWEYDNNGNEIYYEDGDGLIRDNRYE